MRGSDYASRCPRPDMTLDVVGTLNNNTSGCDLNVDDDVQSVLFVNCAGSDEYSRRGLYADATPPQTPQLPEHLEPLELLQWQHDPQDARGPGVRYRSVTVNTHSSPPNGEPHGQMD